MKHGRPRLTDDAATRRVSLRVTAAQQLELRQVAKENGTDISGVLRDAVSDYVADYREKGRLFPRRP